MKTLKVLSALLTYPTSELMAAANDMKQVLSREALLGPRQIKALTELIHEMEGGDLFDLQERYLLLFDRTRSLSLHLFEHVHGESRTFCPCSSSLRPCARPPRPSTSWASRPMSSRR